MEEMVEMEVAVPLELLVVTPLAIRVELMEDQEVCFPPLPSVLCICIGLSPMIDWPID